MQNMAKGALETFQSYLWKDSEIVSAKTINQYTSVFGKLLRSVGGNPNKITEKTLELYAKQLNSRVAVRQLRTVVKYAQAVFPDIQNLDQKKWQTIHQFKRKTMRNRTLISSKAILTRIYSVDHEIAQVMMLISLHTGCRMGALARLKVSDYDDQTKQMHLVEKGNKQTTYQLDEFTLIERLEAILAGKKPQEHPLLAMRTIQSYCESIDLQAHDFRRLYAKKVQIAFVEDGYTSEEALEKTREAMNHESVDTTYGYASYGAIRLTQRKGGNHER